MLYEVITDLVAELDAGAFRRVLVRAGLISAAVFVAFALLGDVLFDDVLQARFASFQIFGGVVFLLIGLQFVFNGPGALSRMRGEPEHIAGAIALPSYNFV